MSRISRLAVLVTALASLFAVLSSTAGAATFTNSGSTAFTATGGAGTLGITSTAGGGGTAEQPDLRQLDRNGHNCLRGVHRRDRHDHFH